MLVQAAAEEYLEVLVTTRVGMIGATSRFDSFEVLAVAFPVAAQHDHNRAGVVARAPVPVVLVIADGFRQSILWTKEIYRARLAVAVGEDCRLGTFLRREAVIDLRYRRVISSQPNSSAKCCGSGPVFWFSAFGGSKPRVC